MRNLKVMGLALVAMLAMSAVVASAASATNFTAASYPVALSGSQPGGAPHTFAVGGGSVECETAVFTGTGAAASETQTITPNYGGAGACEAFGFLGATVTLNGCDYLFNVAGTVNLVCPSGKDVTIADELNLCVVHIGPQTGINGISYKNNGNHVDVTAASTNIKATVTKNSIFCPVAGGNYTNASYSGTVTLKGDNGATKIDVG